MTKKKALNPSTFIKPRRWIVFRTQGMVRSAWIQHNKDLLYYQSRPDIESYVIVEAFNRNEAWHKGKALLETSSSLAS